MLPALQDVLSLVGETKMCSLFFPSAGPSLTGSAVSEGAAFNSSEYDRWGSYPHRQEMQSVSK